MSNPYTDRKAGLIGTAGRKNERKVAKKLGARLTPNSGAMAHSKGDMHTSAFLIEHKSTSSETLSIKREWLLKIAHEALHTNRIPALAFSFTTTNGDSKIDGEWVAVPATVWKELFE